MDSGFWFCCSPGYGLQVKLATNPQHTGLALPSPSHFQSCSCQVLPQQSVEQWENAKAQVNDSLPPYPYPWDSDGLRNSAGNPLTSTLGINVVAFLTLFSCDPSPVRDEEAHFFIP